MEGKAVAQSCSGSTQRDYFQKGTEACWAGTTHWHSCPTTKEGGLWVWLLLLSDSDGLITGLQARWFLGMKRKVLAAECCESIGVETVHLQLL